jgi:L-proline amide hydrolase
LTGDRFSWDGHETWYRVVGDESSKTPVVICHGGPGAAHDYVEPIADLIRYGRACAEWAIFEESSHMPHVEEPEAFLERVEQFLQTID